MSTRKVEPRSGARPRRPLRRRGSVAVPSETKPHAPTALAPRQIPSPKEVLATRGRIRARRPRFRRQESWRYKRVRPNWRRPKGIDSKMRLAVKGWPRLVKIGFRGPRFARGLHPSGLMERFVRNLSDLEVLDPSTQLARLAHGLGRRARASLLARAQVRGIRVLNPGKRAPVKEEAKS